MLPYIDKILKFFIIFVGTLSLYANESSKEHIKLQLQWKHQFEFAGFYAAKEKGFYNDVGLDVEFIEYDSSGSITENLLKGKVDYALSYSSIIAEYAEGKPLLFVANFFKQSPLVLVTQKSIKEVSQLKGKKVMGVSDSIDNITLITMLNKFNISPKDIERIPTSFGINDFINKKVDAMSIFTTNELYELKKRGVEFNLFDPTLYGAKYYDLNLFTTQSEQRYHPERVAKMREASIRGWEYALSHQDEMVEIILKRYNTQNKSREALFFEAKQTKQIMLPKVYKIGSIDRFRVKAIADNFIQSNFIKSQQAIDLDSFIYKDTKDLINLTSQERSYLSQKKSITMCVDPNWMPFEGIKNKQHIGIASDFMKLISRIIDTPITLVSTDSWMESLKRATQRDCDILSLAQETTDRLKYWDFTTPYLESPIVIATEIGTPFINSLQQIHNKKIGVVRGYFFAEKLKELYPNMDIIELDSMQDGLEEVYNGDIYGYIDTLSVINTEIQKNYIGELSISGKLDIILQLSVAIRNDEKILHDIFEKAILSLNKDTKSRIINSWIHIYSEKYIDYKLIWQIIILAFVFL